MTVQSFVELIVTFVREHQAWAMPIAFLVAFGESFCFLSLLWPGTAILAGIAALAAASGVEAQIIVPLIVAAGLGGTVGYAVSYWIGRYFETRVARIWPFSTHPNLIPRGEAFFLKYGAWGVFLGHFFGPVRAVIPVVAGIFRMPQLPFQIANLASAFIWAAGIVAPAFYLVTFKDEVFAFLRDQTVLVGVLLFVLAALNSIPTAVFAVPSLVLFVGLGGFYLYAGGALLPAFVAGLLGAMAGDLVGWQRGRGHAADLGRLHMAWDNGWGKAAADRALALAERWGSLALPPSKFHTTLRGYFPLAAGAKGLSIVPFVILSGLSAALWSGVLLAPMPLARQYLGW